LAAPKKLFSQSSVSISVIDYGVFFQLAGNGLGYEQLRGLSQTFASTRQAENSAGIFRISL
jgi:hypothetical protein